MSVSFLPASFLIDFSVSRICQDIGNPEATKPFLFMTAFIIINFIVEH